MATMKIYPSADTYVDEASPGAREGSSTTLEISGWTGSYEYTFLKFNLASIPSNAIIENIALMLYTKSTTRDSAYTYLHFVSNDSWSENINWDEQPSISSLLYNGSRTYANSTWERIMSSGLLSRVKSEFQGDKMISFRLSTGTSCNIDFGSRQYSSSYRPYLEITYTEIINVKETINWNATVHNNNHPFYLFSYYGTDTDGTLENFQIEKGTYTIITTPTLEGLSNDLTTNDISQFDCLTIIAEGYNTLTEEIILPIYDWEIKKSVI